MAVSMTERLHPQRLEASRASIWRLRPRAHQDSFWSSAHTGKYKKLGSDVSEGWWQWRQQLAAAMGQMHSLARSEGRQINTASSLDFSVLRPHSKCHLLYDRVFSAQLGLPEVSWQSCAETGLLVDSRANQVNH